MPRQTAADIFSQFEHIRERMEQAYQRVLGAPGRPGFCEPFMEPPVDVYETESEVVVVMEMAGIAEQEIDLQTDGATLFIRGHRRPLLGRPRRVYSQMEICDGAFQRELVLPAEVNPDGAQAVYKDGILEIALPKASPAAGRQLRIVVH
jgi:HSP20 family protein